LTSIEEASGAEAFAAGTGAGGVRVFEFEPTIVQSFDVIEFTAGDVGSAFGIDDDADSGGFDEDIAVSGVTLEFHLVLETGATATDDGDSEDPTRESALGEHGADPFSGGGGESDNSFVAHAIGGGLGYGGRIVCQHRSRLNM
jgi:hypothetical protein